MGSRVGVLVFVLVTAAAAVAHGRYTGRWVPLPPLTDYTARLDRLPMEAGDWAAEVRPLDDEESLGRAGIAGFSHRLYRNRKNGQALTVMVVCGRPGPISAHTPDVCYRGMGYTPSSDQARTPVAVPNGPAVPFWTLRLRPPANRPDLSELEILWAWATPGAGQLAAPDNARLANAGEPAVYKLYVIHDRPSVAAARPDVAGFLAAFAPQLTATVRDTP